MPMATKCVRGMTYHEGVSSIKSNGPLIILPRRHDKLKLLYLHYPNACGHKTWQAGDLS